MSHGVRSLIGQDSCRRDYQPGVGADPLTGPVLLETRLKMRLTKTRTLARRFQLDYRLG